jgi:HK97 family phage portal protein
MNLLRMLVPPERRLSEEELYTILRGESGTVSTSNALHIATVFACSRVLAEGIAMLPLVLYERNGRIRNRAETHPLYTMLHDLPNPEMTSTVFRMTMQGHLAVWGNAYAQIVFDNAGRRRQLWPLRPDRMEVKRNAEGELEYHYTRENSTKRVFAWWEIMHLAGLGFDGLIGYSPIAVARRTFERKQRMEDYEAAFWGNMARPDVVLKTPKKLSDRALLNLRSSWQERHEGPNAAGRFAVLEEGLDITVIGIPQSDAQFLESQRFSRQEIAALFRVPLHMINDLDRATFSNIEEQGQEFIDYTLGIWLRVWEQAIYRDLLTVPERSRYYAKFVVQGLLRGNHVSRAQFYHSMTQIGAMSINDVRELEDMNPVEDGDTYFVPLNMTPLEQAVNGPAVVESEPEPEPEAQETEPTPQRSVSGSVLAPIVEDVVRRIVRRSAADVTALGGKNLRRGGPQQLRTWLNEYAGAQVDVVVTMLQPIAPAVGLSESRLERIGAWYAERLAMLAELDETQNDDDAITRLVDEIEGIRSSLEVTIWALGE